jgi:farnesyl-diphosphate farnesyltransferase
MTNLDDLLLRTSRTFGLSIPLLPEPTRREVTIAYLLFRIADTLEDASHWPRAERLSALLEFGRLLETMDLAEARRLADRWVELRPVDHPGYLDLLRDLAGVMGAFRALDSAIRDGIARHLGRTVEGMAGFVAGGEENGSLQLQDLADLRRYCYVVAGIVGEMLTDLFLVRPGSLERVAAILRANAAAFGEGLQLVNILKDAAADARHGRVYLPAGVERAQVFALARRDLDAAHEYVLALLTAGAAQGLVAFTALPVLLARATLDRVERHGAGAKLTRLEVVQLRSALDQVLASGKTAQSPEEASPFSATAERLRACLRFSSIEA